VVGYFVLLLNSLILCGVCVSGCKIRGKNLLIKLFLILIGLSKLAKQTQIVMWIVELSSNHDIAAPSMVREGIAVISLTLGNFALWLFALKTLLTYNSLRALLCKARSLARSDSITTVEEIEK
jgi:hypothetical protein